MTEKNNTAKEDKNNEGGVQYVPIEHIGVEESRTIYANHILIQHNAAGEFFLSFFDMAPPIVMGTEEERAAQLKEISKQDAHCVARIGLSKERMASVIGALAENYAKFSRQDTNEDASREEQKHEQVS